MIEDPFALLAELALGLAGFAGVMAAFGGRDREFRPTERVRLQSLFCNAAVVLVGCGCVSVMSKTAADDETVIFVAGLATLLFYGSVGLPLLTRAFRRANDPSSTSEPWALYLSLANYVVTVGLLLSSIVMGGRGWLLLAAHWLQLLNGLWMFTRILTRPN